MDNISFLSDTRDDALLQTVLIRRTGDPFVCSQLTNSRIYNPFFVILRNNPFCQLSYQLDQPASVWTSFVGYFDDS